jgi:hypothetical protein
MALRRTRGSFPMTYLAHIDGQRFAIADEAVDTFAASIVAALRSGGNFVDLPIFHWSAGPTCAF